VIGLRVTDASIWAVPVMLHEFGHFAATRLETAHGERPGVNLVDGSWLAAAFRSDPLKLKTAQSLLGHPRAHEFFADVFAAYTIGVAYAGLTLWRAGPNRAWDSSGDHPGWGYRMNAVLRAIAKCGEEGRTAAAGRGSPIRSGASGRSSSQKRVHGPIKSLNARTAPSVCPSRMSRGTRRSSCSRRAKICWAHDSVAVTTTTRSPSETRRTTCSTTTRSLGQSSARSCALVRMASSNSRSSSSGADPPASFRRATTAVTS
jgi:hypothetical protein